MEKKDKAIDTHRDTGAGTGTNEYEVETNRPIQIPRNEDSGKNKG